VAQPQLWVRVDNLAKGAHWPVYCIVW